jgi:UDP-N-acetylmuramate dehydrogenase
MIVESNVPLQPYNSFGIVARAQHLARITDEADLVALRADPQWRDAPRFVLGGGSNIVLTGDVKQLVLKIEIKGLRLVEDNPRAWIVEAGAGEIWHDAVEWMVRNGYPGLENLALIPGTVGGAPVQNIGAYGVELQDRFDSLDAYDLETGRSFTLDAAQCAFGYRDSVFKHVRSGPNDFGLSGRAVITRVRFRLPKPWKAVVGYLDLERKMEETGNFTPARRTSSTGSAPSAGPSCPTGACWATPAASSRTRRSRPSSARTSSRATPRSFTTRWTTAASSWRRAGSSTPAAGRASRSATPACTSARRWCW